MELNYSDDVTNKLRQFENAAVSLQAYVLLWVFEVFLDLVFNVCTLFVCVFVCLCCSLPMHLHVEGKRVINHCLCVRAYVCVFLAFSARYETVLVLTVGMDGSHYL